MAINFKNIAQNATVLSDLMAGRTKVDKTDGEFNIIDFDIVSTGKEPYAVCAISENEFINGGHILTKVFTDIVNEFGGCISDAREEFRNQGGIRVRLRRAKTQLGHDITKVEVI